MLTRFRVAEGVLLRWLLWTLPLGVVFRVVFRVGCFRGAEYEGAMRLLEGFGVDRFARAVCELFGFAAIVVR